jgi:hypothetical protein
VASRATCVLSNCALAKKDSSAATQGALHLRIPTIVEFKDEGNKTKVASRANCVTSNCALSKKDSSAATQGEFHSRIPTIVEFKDEDNKTKVASRAIRVQSNCALAKKDSSAATQGALHSRIPTELIGDHENLMVNWMVDGQISTNVDEDSRKRDFSDVFVNRVIEDQEVKSKGLAQANDILGTFDELLGI